MTVLKRRKSKIRCDDCNRQLWMLPDEKGVYKTQMVQSDHTNRRYCWPGEGCHR